MKCRIVVALDKGIVREAILSELRNCENLIVIECNPFERVAVPNEFGVASQLRNVLQAYDALQETESPWGSLHESALFQANNLAANEEHEICLITNIDSADSVPPDIARWLMEFPDLVVVGIHSTTGRIFSFRQTIDVIDSGNSLSDLVTAVGRLVQPSKVSRAWHNQ